jgi:hypothetical protein
LARKNAPGLRDDGGDHNRIHPHFARIFNSDEVHREDQCRDCRCLVALNPTGTVARGGFDTRSEEFPRRAEDKQDRERAEHCGERAHRGEALPPPAHPQMKHEIMQSGLAGIQTALRAEHSANRRRGGRGPGRAFVGRHLALTEAGEAQISADQ